MQINNLVPTVMLQSESPPCCFSTAATCLCSGQSTDAKDDCSSHSFCLTLRVCHSIILHKGVYTWSVPINVRVVPCFQLHVHWKGQTCTHNMSLESFLTTATNQILNNMTYRTNDLQNQQFLEPTTFRTSLIYINVTLGCVL